MFDTLHTSGNGPLDRNRYKGELYEAETEEVVASASQALSAISGDERALLKRLREFAAKSALRPDCKAQALIDWLKKTLRPGNSWNDERS